MKLSEIELTDINHFIGMEYYYLMLNRTFLIIRLEDYLIGVQGNGIVSVEGGSDILSKRVNALMAIKGDLTNPNSYLKNSYLSKVYDLDLSNKSVLNINKANFKIKLSDIKEVHYNPNKKFGMEIGRAHV